VGGHGRTVGGAGGGASGGETAGAAALSGRRDLGFPDTGVLAEGGLNRPGWVYAEVWDAAVGTVRATGRVRNFAHWAEQTRRLPK